MLRSLLFVAVAASSFACTVENAGPVDEDPVAEEEGALPIHGSVGGGSGTYAPPKCPPQRFDFAISSDDARVCSSFAKTTAAGTWTAFSTFPSAPTKIANARCAVTFQSAGGSCNRVTKAELRLNCQEDLTLTERSAACALAGPACPSATPVVMRPDAKTSMAPHMIESACPATRPGAVLAANVGTMAARTYTGGCGACATIWRGRLYLNSPETWSFVTYYNGGEPHMIGFDNISGPITYDLGPTATGPVMVSY